MEKYDVKFKKKYGQNFLKDDRVVKRIVDNSSIGLNDLVIEVGPGGAILTKELAKRAKNVLAYEIDTDLRCELEKKLVGYDNVKILFKDFLESDINSDITDYDYDNIYFISNVPYYITTPIVMKLIDSNIKFKKIMMMVQKEVGQRFSSKPGSKSYSSISVFLGYYYDVRLEFNVSRYEFVPVPNVDSAVIKLVRHNKYQVNNEEKFFKFVKQCFLYKRKNIRNNLKGYDLEKVSIVLKNYGHDLSSRAEEFSMIEFIDLYNSLF